jgi:hypothetical protein
MPKGATLYGVGIRTSSDKRLHNVAMPCFNLTNSSFSKGLPSLLRVFKISSGVPYPARNTKIDSALTSCAGQLVMMKPTKDDHRHYDGGDGDDDDGDDDDDDDDDDGDDDDGGGGDDDDDDDDDDGGGGGGGGGDDDKRRDGEMVWH